MVDSVNTGYKYDAVEILFSGSELGVLAAGNFSAASDVINVDYSTYLDLDGIIKTTSATLSGATWGIYLIPAVRPDVFADWTAGASDSPANEKWYRGSFTLKAASGDHIVSETGIALPAGNYKLGFRNNTAQASLAASKVYRRAWRLGSQ